MNLDSVKSVYFVGIGGIGMSALARYFKQMGLPVAGYDRTPSPLTQKMVDEEGFSITYEDDVRNIDELYRDKAATLVVYTPAIPKDNHILAFFWENGYSLHKRAEVLGILSQSKKALCVAGTHGKTTTTTLLAFLLKNSHVGCSAFLGGISSNFKSNLLIDAESAYVVIEADEFDRSFLQLHPEIAVITSMDADHLDIYSDIEHVREAFRAFASQVSGTLIIKYGLDISPKDTGAKIFTYSYDVQEADFHAENISVDGCGYFTFDLHYPRGIIFGCSVGVPGWVNVENGIAAAAIALTYGIAPDRVKAALKTFSGVKRRFDIHVNRPGCAYIDDYAHHPKEIEAAMSSIREIFPGRKITAVFQPHLYTRTRDFAADFAKALGGADKLILLDIYPAREEPIPGVSSEMIFKDVDCPEKVMIRKEGLMQYLEKEPVDILVTFGAGNIDRFTGPITEMLENRSGK